MPKKRHFNKYNKPQSTAPASIASSSPSSTSPNRQQRGVNELLSDLRRTSTPPNRTDFATNRPSVPPVIREILQLPETPAPLPRTRNRYRLDARGRRLPAGPPPPRSWQTVTRRESPGDGGTSSTRADGAAAVLPGEYVPARGSLVDMLLRLVVTEWPALGPLEELGLWTLPDRTRQGLLRYLDVYCDGDVTLNDVKAVLVPDQEDTVANADFAHLHVPSSLLSASTFPSLISLLFPKPAEVAPNDEPLDSWEVVDLTPAPPRNLVPALTHLSLALDPSRVDRSPPPSWRHLLQLAKKMPGITHLNLAFWPEPMRTPNAKFASVVGPQGNSVQYGGTGFYSHSLDQDWSEAVNILRTLSRRLYQLEYLDITGCGAWFPALMKSGESVDGEESLGGTGVDWAGDWARVAFVRMGSGVKVTGDESDREKEKLRADVEMAGAVERHITMQRAGKGRIITVERDDPYSLR